MSKILFSVLCVILSLVALFTFVRAAFGVSPLSAQQLVERVSTLDFDFSTTKKHLSTLKEIFENIEFPELNNPESFVYTDEYIQEGLRMEAEGLSFVKGVDNYSFDGDILVCPNGARFEEYEYYRTIRSDGKEFVQVHMAIYSLADRIVHEVKGWFMSAESEEGTLLYALAKITVQISAILGYIADVFGLFLQLFVVVYSLAKDSVFFVVDAVLLLLYFLGIDTTSALPAV